MKIHYLGMTAIWPFLLLLESVIAFTTPVVVVGHGWRFALHRIHVMNEDQNENFNMEELNQRIVDESNPYAKLFLTNGWEYRSKPNNVHIILFKPDTEDEGVHTIEYPMGSENNVILAFECSHECDTFAAALKFQQFFDPSPQSMNLNDLEAYCEQLGVLINVVPRGTFLIPPEARVEQLDHNPLLRNQKEKLEYLMALNNNLESESFASTTIVQKLDGNWE